MNADMITPMRTTKEKVSAKAFVPWIVFLVVLVVLPFLITSGTGFTLLNAIAINIVFALSYNMLLGQGGMLSFGHAVFFGLGSYAAMHAMIFIDEASYAEEGLWAHVPVFTMPLIGFIAGGLVALVLGWPFCRRAGTAFAMITLGLGEMVAAAGQMFPTLFGGEAGIYGNRMVGPELFGLELARSSDVYWFMAFWTFVAVLAMWAFTRTPLGRLSNAVRDNPDRLQFIGYQPRNVRFMVFIFAGAFGGLAGGMSAVNYEIITPEALGLIPSGLALLMAAVGGLGVFYGPIIGAILITLMNSLLNDYSDGSILYVGLVFLAIVMFAPKGLAGGIEQGRMMWRTGVFQRRLPGWIAAFASIGLIALGTVALVELLFAWRHGGDHIRELLTLDLNPATVFPWVVMVLLIGGGITLLRVTKQYREENE